MCTFLLFILLVSISLSAVSLFVSWTQAVKGDDFWDWVFDRPNKDEHEDHTV